MEGVNYPELVQTILEGHSIHHSNDDTEVQLIFDPIRNHYQVVHLGWEEEGMRRVYGCIIHVDIKDGKIWIQRDGTEIGVEERIVRKRSTKAGYRFGISCSLQATIYRVCCQLTLGIDLDVFPLAS